MVKSKRAARRALAVRRGEGEAHRRALSLRHRMARARLFARRSDGEQMSEASAARANRRSITALLAGASASSVDCIACTYRSRRSLRRQPQLSFTCNAVMRRIARWWCILLASSAPRTRTLPTAAHSVEWRASRGPASGSRICCRKSRDPRLAHSKSLSLARHLRVDDDSRDDSLALNRTALHSPSPREPMRALKESAFTRTQHELLAIAR